MKGLREYPLLIWPYMVPKTIRFRILKFLLNCLDPLVVAKGRGIICICLEKSADLHGFSSTTGLQNHSFIQDLFNQPTKFHHPKKCHRQNG